MKLKLQAVAGLFVSLFLFACKKQISDQSSSANIQGKVIAWLSEQKSISQPNKAANIDLLTKNLDFEGVTSESSHDGEKLLIIPITDLYKKLKRISNSSEAILLIKLTAEDEIRDGNIVLYTPPNPADKIIPSNTFNAIINTGDPACEGEFKFLSVTGRRLYTLTYRNGSLAKEVRFIQKNNINSRTDAICIDWYLVTTIYYTDGTKEETEEYIGTTCRGCDCGDIQCDCPDDGSGGGGTAVEYEYEVARSMKWKVASPPNDPSNSKGIWSVERIRGKRVSSEPQGGHFTSLSNFANYCDFCAYLVDEWNRGNHTYSIPSPQSISCTVWGYLLYAGHSYKIDNTNWWSFADVF